MSQLAQRWRDGSHHFRPAAEPIRTADYEVASIPDDNTAKRFVAAHHYSGSFPAARFRFGLYRRGGELAGVSVFSVPMQAKVFACLPGDPSESVELGRFVLLDNVPGNGETWFLGACFRALKSAGIVGVVSFSDPVPRRRADGATVFAGHVGTIYQAHNAAYLGRGSVATLRILPDGRVFSNRSASKIRQRERGWAYAVAELQRYGAGALGAADDPAAWLRTWVPRITRPLRHRGNHKYAWVLDRRARRHLTASLPYPKQTDLPA